MLSSSPYIPVRTDARNPALTDSHISRHKNALFETIRVESSEKRAEGLARIWTNLSTWACLAYPAARGKDVLAPSSHSNVDRPRMHRDTSGEGVFDLDDEEAWSDSELRKTKYESSTTLEEHPDADAAPWASPSPAYQAPGYGDYSMYGTEDTAFLSSRSGSDIREILKSYLLATLRATVDCPFADVRRFCRFVLERLFLVGISVPDLICAGPSWLIPAVETIAFGHDSATETASQIPRYVAQSRRHHDRSKPFIPASYDSDMSDQPGSIESYTQTRSGIPTPVSRSPLDFVPTGGRSADDVVFESDESYSGPNSQHSRSSSSSIQPDTTSTAIPITSKKAPRGPIGSSDIDDILLGPVGTRTSGRKARFSIGTDMSRKENRPALSRKRTNSNTYTIHQRRAHRNLRAFHLSCYLSTGRVTNFGRILSYFPRFYETTIVLHDELIRKQGGPLQRMTKLYLAIIAAAQANCQYLVSYFSKKFAQLGSNLDWLDGLDKAPRKIQRLGKLNALLSHQPWRINKEHIEELLGRSKESLDSGDLSDQWTMGELVQSICILVVVNCQAHLCLGTGVVPEPDTFGGACIRRHKPERTTPNSTVNVYPLFTSYDSGAFASPASYHNSYKGKFASNVVPGDSPCMVIPTKALNRTSENTTPIESDTEETIPSLLWKRRQSFNQSKLWTPKADNGADNDFDPKGIFAQCGVVEDDGEPSPSSLNHKSPLWIAANLVKKSPGTEGLLDHIPQSSELLDGMGGEVEAGTMPVNPILEDMTRFHDSSHACPSPSEFDTQGREFQVLRLVDCNWEDHTCSLIGRFVPNLETVLDQNLQEARVAAGDEDDGFFFSSENGTVDQGPLRDAVWFFILRLYGIYNDGYAYSDVNLLLNKSAKRFLKKVCFRPEQISRADWRSIGKGLKSQERVLLTLLATHARMYACLVYAFRYCQ